MSITKQRSCDGKVPHDSELMAVRVARTMAQGGQSKIHELHPYQCLFCGKWHLGHADPETQELVKAVLHKHKHPLIRMK